MLKKTIQIMHLHATRYNVGDDAIVIATYKLLEKLYPDTIFSFFDVARDRYTRPGESTNGFLPLYKYHKLKYWPKLFRFLLLSNVILIGGGELICGAIEFLGIALIAKLIRRPVVFYGIGSNMQNVSTILLYYTKIVLYFTDYIIVRDAESFNEISSLVKDTSKILLSADIVFTLRPEKEKIITSTREKEKKDLSSITIGVSLRSQESASRSFNENKLRIISQLLDNIIEKSNARIIFFPFLDERSPYEKKDGKNESFSTDKNIMFSCQALMTYSNKTTIYSADLNPFTIMNEFRQLDFILAMRLHASILALNAGIVPFAFNYAPKIEKIFNMLGLHENIINLDKLEEVSQNFSTFFEKNFDDHLNKKCMQFKEIAEQNISCIERFLFMEKKRLSLLMIPLGLAGLLLHILIHFYCSFPRNISIK